MGPGDRSRLGSRQRFRGTSPRIPAPSPLVTLRSQPTTVRRTRPCLRKETRRTFEEERRHRLRAGGRGPSHHRAGRPASVTAEVAEEEAANLVAVSRGRGRPVTVALRAP